MKWFFLIMACVWMIGKAEAVKRIGHRGMAAHWPENTLIGFEKALECGVDGIEMDVHLTKDGVVVVHHDFVLNSAIAREKGEWVTGTYALREMTCDQLQSFDVGVLNKDTSYGKAYPNQQGVEGQSIPTLRQVIELVLKKEPKTELWIELKTDPSDVYSSNATDLAKETLKIVREYPLLKVVFISFDWTGLDYLAEQGEGLKLGYLSEKASFSEIKEIGDFWNVSVKHMKESVFQVARSRGKQIGFWTVNDRESMKKWIEKGAYSITTDRPDLLNTVLIEEGLLR